MFVIVFGKGRDGLILSRRSTSDDSYRSGSYEIPVAQKFLEMIAVHFDGGEIIIGQRGMDPRRWLKTAVTFLSE